MKTEDVYNNLIQSLRLVSSPPNIQVEVLPDFVNVPDEIALIYNESYIMVPQVNDVISPYALKILDDLDKLFEEMSKVQSLWNIESLKNDDSWKKSRELGHLILNELNETYTKPNLNFIKWVK